MTLAHFIANVAFPRALLVWCMALACAPRRPAASQPAGDMAQALSAMERKVCLTSGVRTNKPSDRCESQVDRATYIEPLRERGLPRRASGSQGLSLFDGSRSSRTSSGT